MLNSELTNWDDLYLRIKFSALGSDFTTDRFLATPIKTLLWLVEKITEHEQLQHNIAAIPVAHLNTQVTWALYGMGGGKGPKPRVGPKDFLPFPEGTRPKTRVADLDATRASLKQALATGELPYDIFIALWRGPSS